MGKKKYKEYINYQCQICLRCFGNRKDNWEYHLNKKYPCKAIDKNTQVLQTPPDLLQFPPELHTTESKNKCIETDKKINEEPNEIKSLFICEFCNSTFVKKYNLDRHLNGRCKEKQNQTKNLESTDTLKLILDEINELKKENKELKEKICFKLPKKKSDVNINIVNNNVSNTMVNNSLTHNMITNNTLTNNTNTNNIVNFSNMDFSNMDKKLFINPLMNIKLYGKDIILKMVENIYINEKHPEYHNIIVTDKNRGYVKVFNNGRWKTNDVRIINSVLDGIIEHSKTILDELYKIYETNANAKSRLNTSTKYVKLCDLEHLADLEDEHANGDANNSVQISRCKDFREMVYKDTINLFHDNKNILIKPKKIKN
jgi:hypothetical protein